MSANKVDFIRHLQLTTVLRKKSVLLLGPRQTGKTRLIRQAFPSAPCYNLLDSKTFLKLAEAPHLMVEELSALPQPIRSPILIDEVQKLPRLPDEVHNAIESRGWTFLLTGSSARPARPWLPRSSTSSISE